MARIFRRILSCASVLRECAHTLGCILGTLPNHSYIYKLPYSASVSQLPGHFVESSSPEVFKHRTKHPSVQNGLDEVLLIRRKRLDFSVKVRFSLECS